MMALLGKKTDRCRKTPRELIRGALLQVRQDWKFAAEVFGFPANNTKDGCCWECKCTPAEVHGFLCVCIERSLYLSLSRERQRDIEREKGKHTDMTFCIRMYTHPY